MTFRSLLRFSALGTLLGVALACVTPAHASLAPQLNIQTGSYNTSGGIPTGTIFTGAGGIVSAVNVSTGGFTISNAIGTSTPPLGSASSIAMDLSSVTIANSGGAGGTVFLTLTDNNFTPAGLPGLATMLSVMSAHFIGNGSGSIEFKAWASSTNTLWSMTGPLVTDATGLNTSVTSTSAALASPFSMTLQVIVTLTAGSSVSLDGSSVVTAAPEPGTIAAALMGLPLAYMGFRSRRRKA